MARPTMVRKLEGYTLMAAVRFYLVVLKIVPVFMWEHFQDSFLYVNIINLIVSI